MKGPNPFLLASEAAKRKSGGRAQRRAAEALERKSIPALKKEIRRNKQRRKKK